MTLSKDDDEEVRSNAVFAMGVLLANSGESMYSYPPSVFSCSVSVHYSVYYQCLMNKLNV